jgi:hypothetical protein
MKIIDFILNSLRFSIKEIVVLLFLISVIYWSWYVENTILDFDWKNKELQKIKSQKQAENEEYNYVEDILAEHHDYLEKFKSIQAPDLFWLQQEIESLIPRWIQIEETKLDWEEFLLRWVSPDLRSIDFLVSILNMYNNYYGWFDWEVVLESVVKKETLQSFRITWKINSEKIIDKIYSNDIDGDWVEDSVIEEVVNSSWVKQKKSIIKDYCPFTPSFNIVIWKLIESNQNIIDTFPYYKELYNKWFFNFNNKTWCLENSDTEIKYKNNEN